MSASQVKLLIEPNPKAPSPGTFIQGYPGIPASPTRPPARIAGVVHVRAPQKGIQAAWLRIELRKNESIPPGDHWAELIGRGPIDLWTAPGVDTRVAHATANRVARGKMEPGEEPQDWELLKDSTYQFVIPIPEGLPPSARIDKQSAITYDLVASVCIQTKKGLLKKEFHSNVIQAVQLITIEKHELHSMHPIYHIADEHAANTAASPPNEPTSIVTAKVFRNQTCYGPGDTVNVRVIVSSERISPVKLRNISFAVRETITFRGGSGGTTRSGAPTAAPAGAGSGPGNGEAGSESAPSMAPPSAAGVQRTDVICSKSKSIGKKMYKGDKLMFDLSAPIPKTHNLMSVATAKHIGVSYTMRIVVDLGGGDKATATSAPLNAAKENAGSIVMDHLPMTITNFLRTVSEDIVRAIGHVDGLSAGGSGGAAGLLRDGPDDAAAMQMMQAQGMRGPPQRAYTGDMRPQAYPEQRPSGGGGDGYGQYAVGGQPGMLRRSRSTDGSSSTLSGAPLSPTTPTMMNAIRRSDTLFSQRTAGTNISGPGLAGRGVPGQLFHWDPQQADPVRPSAFVSGPGSIYHGRTSNGARTASASRAGGPVEPSELAVGAAMMGAAADGAEFTDAAGPGGRALNEAELAALFHHTDRADSAAQMLGLDPTLFVNDLSSYSGFRAGQKIRANHQMQDFQRNPLLSQLAVHPDSIPPSAPASVYSGGSGITRPPTVMGAPSIGGYGPSNNGLVPGRPIPQGMNPAEQQAERVRVQREQAAMQHQVRNQVPPPAQAPSPSSGSSAAGHQRNVSTPVIRGPGIALHPGYNGKSSSPAPGSSSAAQRPSASSGPVQQGSPSKGAATSAAAAPYLSAEEEKRRLYERARSEAEQYQSGFAQGAQFPPREGQAEAGGSASGAGSSPAVQQAAPVPAYSAAAQYARPQSMMELGSIYQAASTASPLLAAAVAEQHHAAAAAAAARGDAPSPAPTRVTSTTQGLPIPPAVHASAYTSAETEKEQMRRFYEARDAVERYQAGSAGPSGSLSGAGATSSAGGSSSAAAGYGGAVGGNALAAGAGGNGQGTSLQRQNTAFFEPYETAPVPSYAKAIQEVQQQQQQERLYQQSPPSANPLTSALHDPALTEAQDGPDAKGKNTVIAHAPPPVQHAQPAFATSGAQLPAPILLGSSSTTPSTVQATAQPAPGQAPPPSFSPAPSTVHSSAISEKEQMRLYYAARDMQAQAENVASGVGSSSGGAPLVSAHAPGVVSPTPGYAPGFAGRAPASPAPPAAAAASVPSAAFQGMQLGSSSGPSAVGSSATASSSSSAQSQGMPASRPPPLPASLLQAATAGPSGSGSGSGSSASSSSVLQPPYNQRAQPPPSPLKTAYNLSTTPAPQLPQLGSLVSPMSFTMPPPPAGTVASGAPPHIPPRPPMGGGAGAGAGAGSQQQQPPSLVRVPTMPRRAFEEENYTDEGQSAVAVPPPRPPKAASIILAP
ncbi:hypothetical protein OC844_000641 [Tilletia horrida]|nr:hypothetical protein OC844_000641 [Tilletia horrida]